MKKFILSIIFATISMFATAGPYGLEMGLTKDQIIRSGVELRPIDESKGWYRATNIPLALGDFAFYTLVISPDLGLCSILAQTREIKTNSHGDEIKKAYSDIEIMLSRSYGDSRKIDALKNTSITYSPEDWSRSMAAKARIYATFWSAKEGSQLKDSIISVVLSANLLDPNTGDISVLYVFENYNKCR